MCSSSDTTSETAAAAKKKWNKCQHTKEFARSNVPCYLIVDLKHFHFRLIVHFRLDMWCMQCTLHIDICTANNCWNIFIINFIASHSQSMFARPPPAASVPTRSTQYDRILPGAHNRVSLPRQISSLTSPIGEINWIKWRLGENLLTTLNILFGHSQQM